MSQTVIGFFDEQSDAQKAIEQLQSKGISRVRIDFSRSGAGTGSTGNSSAGRPDVNPVSGSERDDNSVRRTSDDRTVDREGRNTNIFTDFFNNLFGGSDDKDDADRYSRVAERSNAIVTVHTQTREEAERVADILDDCGAIDVDERASQYGYTNPHRSSDIGSGRATISGNISANENAGRGHARMRSRIFDRQIDENRRLRNLDSGSDPGYNAGNPDNSKI